MTSVSNPHYIALKNDLADELVDGDSNGALLIGYSPDELGDASNVNAQLNHLLLQETVSDVPGTNNITTSGITTIDSTLSAVTATLPDGSFLGQTKKVGFIGSNSSTLSVTTHSTSNPEVFTFDTAGDYLVLEWTGTEWVTVFNHNVTT